MDSGRTFIVRLYRQAGRRIVGVIEDVNSGRRVPFASADELWTALSARSRRLSSPSPGSPKPK
jgi:hypothetical protein